jgi:hypothetical protein
MRERKMGMTPAQAVKVADAYADGTLVTENDYFQIPWLRDIGERMRRSAYDWRAFTLQDLDYAKQAHGAELIGHLHSAVYTAEAVRRWQRHRVVYQVHPALFEAIAETETTSKVPCEVFLRLPHPDPFIVFPTPILSEPDPRSTAPVVEPPMLTGMLITGLTGEREQCSTADSTVRHLNVAIAGQLRYAGQEPTYEERVLTLPTVGLKAADEMAHEMIGLVSLHNPDQARYADDRDIEAFRLAINILLYVCSTGADMRTIQTAVDRGRRKNADARRRANTNIVGVGFHVGAALLQARERSSAPRVDELGGSVRPHIRKAHWHTYWTGPKSAPQIPELRWLHPIIVHPDERDRSVSTVIPVN